MTSAVLNAVGRVVTDVLLPTFDGAGSASTRPFAASEAIRPLATSGRYGVTHYGVFFPLLPEPHRYLNIMTLLGQTGTLCFDNDYLVTGDPRQTATLFTSTAAPDAHLYRAYDMSSECDLAPNGSVVRFGDELEIRGSWPDFRVTLSHGDLALEATVQATDVVSYFVKSPIYDHFSLLAQYEGELSYAGEDTTLSGLCTFEFARAATPYLLRHTNLPPRWKLPVDFFTYQVINLDASTQLLLTDVRVNNRTATKTLHIRSLDGSAQIFADEVHFEVLETEPEPASDPEGSLMSLPTRLRWRVRKDGREVLTLEGHVDSPWRHGHGKGYASSYTFTGQLSGQDIAGRGYIEYVDCR